MLRVGQLLVLASLGLIGLSFGAGDANARKAIGVSCPIHFQTSRYVVASHSRWYCPECRTSHSVQETLAELPETPLTGAPSGPTVTPTPHGFPAD